MRKLSHAGSYRELLVYQKARELAGQIYQLSKTFPKEEMYSLTDQIRRSSRSVGAQIAEAWAKRKYERHFISKLTDADGEQQETQHWLEIAHDCEYISPDEKVALLNLCQEIGKMLSSMIMKATQFCSETLKYAKPLPSISPLMTDHCSLLCLQLTDY